MPRGELRPEPTDGKDPESMDAHGSQIYKTIARRLAAKIAERAKEHSCKFPGIKVMNT